jgi:hypothetical protein
MLFDLWIVILTILFFIVTAIVAVSYDRLMGARR